MAKWGQKPLIIAFSGIDGSGKTTQARLLVAALAQAHGPDHVGYSHGNRPIFKGDGKGADAARFHHHHRGFVLTLAILAKDVLKIVLFVWQHRRRSVIVFDRHLDDALAKARLYHQSAPRLERLARLLAPKPALVVWLDVPPEVSFARDREYPLSYHQAKREIYADIFKDYQGGDHLALAGVESAESIHTRLRAVMRERSWL